SDRPPESDFVARVEQLRTQVDEDGFLTDSGTRFGEPVLISAETAPEEAAPERPDVDEGSGGKAPGTPISTPPCRHCVCSFLLPCWRPRFA
ncbi:MAG TPA: hypothetical protein VLA17_12100, partial [Candidatus Limnocylindria bacterium]|nr:hypothetical protein [Candidatus Limnocylindria bacterium]